MLSFPEVADKPLHNLRRQKHRRNEALEHCFPPRAKALFNLLKLSWITWLPLKKRLGYLAADGAARAKDGREVHSLSEKTRPLPLLD
jgi:hypothetical protein